MKRVQIRSFSWCVFSCIRREYRKIRTRKNSVFGHFSRSAKLNFCYILLTIGDASIIGVVSCFTFEQSLRKVIDMYQNYEGFKSWALGKSMFSLARNVLLLKYTLNQSITASKPKKATLGQCCHMYSLRVEFGY